MPTDSENRYAAPHVWNLVAKELREYRRAHVEPYGSVDEEATVMLIWTRFAERFERDEGFDRNKFFRQVFPDTESD